MKKFAVVLAIFSVFTLTGCTNNTSVSSSPTSSVTSSAASSSSSKKYVANKNSGVLHNKSKCTSLPYEENRIYFSSIEEAHEAGYTHHHKECMGN